MRQNNSTSAFTKNEHDPVDTQDVNGTSIHDTWKAVGNPSRRGSLVTPAINSSNTKGWNNNTNINSIVNTTFGNESPAASPTPNSLPLPAVRRSSFDQSQWGALGGFNWEGPVIFDNETTPQILHQQHPPPPPPDVLVSDTSSYIPHHQHPFSYSNSILPVPILPNISMEPVYRQQRNLSFSVGQEPTFFGYDDYDDASGSDISNNNNQGAISFSHKHLLATMEEEDQDDDDDDEDDDHDTLQGMLDQETGVAAQWRARSQSSGAAFGVLSPAQRATLLNRQLRRGSEQYEYMAQQRRRSSRFFGDIYEPGTSLATAAAAPPMDTVNTAPGQSGYPQMSIGDKERLDLLHRRLSQSHGDGYKFPDQSYNRLHQRRQSLNEPSPSHHYHIQQLSDQFKNTSLHTSYMDYTVSGTIPPDTFGQQSGMPHGCYPLRQQPFQQQIQKQQQQNHQHHQHQELTNLAALDALHSPDNKGVPLQRLPQNTTLFSVEFKAGRPDYFYVVPEPKTNIASKFCPGDLVIVEGDRGTDLGKVASGALSVEHVKLLLDSRVQPQNDGPNNDHGAGAGAGSDDKPKDVHMKRLYRMATSNEIDLLLEKGQVEMQALALCQQKVKLRYLPMSVVDAEYQWDRRKLTFFFVSKCRIDFRELVRELFKIYKTRIWMRAVNTNTINTTAITTLSSSDTISSIEL